MNIPASLTFAAILAALPMMAQSPKFKVGDHIEFSANPGACLGSQNAIPQQGTIVSVDKNAGYGIQPDPGGLLTQVFHPPIAVERCGLRLVSAASAQAPAREGAAEAQRNGAGGHPPAAAATPARPNPAPANPAPAPAAAPVAAPAGGGDAVAHYPATVVAGSYSCVTFAGIVSLNSNVAGRVEVRPLFDVRVTGPNTYTGSDGARGSFTYDPTRGKVRFSGGSHNGQVADYVLNGGGQFIFRGDTGEIDCGLDK